MGRNMVLGGQTLKADGPKIPDTFPILWPALLALCVPQCYPQPGRRCEAHAPLSRKSFAFLTISCGGRGTVDPVLRPDDGRDGFT